MRISKIRIRKFRRFEDLEITGISPSAKLVVLTGPNGSGKSSLFDALLLRYRVQSNYGWYHDVGYYNQPQDPDQDYINRIEVTGHNGQAFARGSLYLRTAHRHDPEFVTQSLARQGDVLENLSLNRLIDADATVSKNYARLASQAMEDLFGDESSAMTFGGYRDKIIGEIQKPLHRLFPDLTFSGVGNPLESGTFKFDKGEIKWFDYKNLSGGEKAAFDLILDFVIKRKNYSEAIYCIDEPELHMNTKVQGALLTELVSLLPESSQLWIGSHSIGMMRRAREMYDADPSSVAFLDFGGQRFDKPVVIMPTVPSRAFWQEVMNVALDDLAALVAPSQVVICEGNPSGPVMGKNSEHDARIYTRIFSDHLPDVTFISAGNSKEVQNDFIGIAAVIPKLAAGIKVTRLIDRDDHALDDILDLQVKGITVLGRRHLEAYLYDDETLQALCASVGKIDLLDQLLARKRQIVADLVAKGSPQDDVKKASGSIYNAAKQILGLTQAGNDAPAFARNTLAGLVKPGMAVYAELKTSIFGR